jgi:hypothetical protein
LGANQGRWRWPSGHKLSEYEGSNAAGEVLARFSPDHEAATIRADGLKSCTWFSVEQNKLARSPAHYWVLVLLGFEKRTYDYVIIEPKALMKKLQAIDDASPSRPRYQVDVWVTKQKPERAWLTRKLNKEDQDQIARGTFKNLDRDLTQFLNNWSAIKSL